MLHDNLNVAIEKKDVTTCSGSMGPTKINSGFLPFTFQVVVCCWKPSHMVLKDWPINSADGKRGLE